MGCITISAHQYSWVQREKVFFLRILYPLQADCKFHFSDFFEYYSFVWENRAAMTITGMAPSLYEAAAKGNIMIFKDDKFKHRLGALLTPNKNTILHIFITALQNRKGKGSVETDFVNSREESVEMNFVRKILKMCPSFLCQVNVKDETDSVNSSREELVEMGFANRRKESVETGFVNSREEFVREILNMCPSLLFQVNVKDETPLHVAARYGHANIVQVLIEYARDSHHQDLESGIEAVKKMLRMENKERDTALHEAVRYNHLEVTKLLIKEDPDFSYSINDVGETPLYIAAERDYQDLVLEILNTCNLPAYDGPIGRTALHAAVLSRNEDTVKAIMGRFRGAITKKADQDGWTPLHLAAYSEWWGSCTKPLLEQDLEVAYMKNNEGRTALHIAAQRGRYRIMESIIKMCPDCCELVDNRGWNALHFAVAADDPEFTVEPILENSSLSNLLNEKNTEGDTPLHHHCRSFTNRILKNLNDHPRVDTKAFNKNNLNARQLALTSANIPYEKIPGKLWDCSRRLFIKEEEFDRWDEYYKEKIAKERQVRKKEYLEKAAQTHLVVAALITTVTFAAAITMPGGFVGTGGNHEGSAVLRRNAAFKVFIITDAISLVLSSSAVVTHLLMPLLFKHSESDETHYDFLKLAFWFILMAMGAMVLAFITGAYAVLAHSLDLAVTTCVIGPFFFLILFFICVKYRVDLGLDIYIFRLKRLFH